MQLGLEKAVVDKKVLDRTVARFREAQILLPTGGQLAEPATIPPAVTQALSAVDPDAPHPLNLFRVHWHNGQDRRARVEVPEHVVLPSAMTGVAAPVIVMLGNRFPMVRAHKVLAAYGCLVPRVVTGQFDPTAHKAVWPSTGNYCRGGVAISRLMRSRGVAILPAGMSQERFDWLDQWVTSPDDVVKTPGSESNVKEIYDKCAELNRDPANVIFNQFCEFGNHLVHYTVTGAALERLFLALKAKDSALELAAFTSATGSAGTIAAGDRLKERFGTRIVAVEALECPTMLKNGYGEHNIQGIGDKHIPLIHNVMNTDLLAAVSDRGTDELGVAFSHPDGRRHLVERRGVPAAVVDRLGDLGLSSICNVLAAIKTAKLLGLGKHQAVVTVATDGAELYGSERQKALKTRFGGRFDAVTAGEVFAAHLDGQRTDHVVELSREDRERIFNLGYYTWVEQQGVSLADFDARKDQAYWKGLRELLPVWDRLIAEFNALTGVKVA